MQEYITTKDQLQDSLSYLKNVSAVAVDAEIAPVVASEASPAEQQAVQTAVVQEEEEEEEMEFDMEWD